jgi:non-specific serine/threonine protein kinase/serine/threonine-protein kinase
MAHGTPHSGPEGSAVKLRRRLCGDLDDIVLMSLRKEPLRRYPSVEQFAEDIRRHLEGLPVTARPDSWKYRAGKFVSRHKLGVAATALILVAVFGGVAATVREARIAAVNQRRAERRFNDVRKLANSLMFEIHDAISDLPGSTSARRLLVTRALEYLDSLSEQSKGDVSLQKELASAYERVGDVLGYPYGANLGDSAGALRSYRKALAIRAPLVHPSAKGGTLGSAEDVQFQRDLVGNYIRVAQVQEMTGNFPEALEALRQALPLVQRVAEGSTEPVAADQYAGTYYFTAIVQGKMGNSGAALEDYQRAAAIREPALRANPGNFNLLAHLAADYSGIASCSAEKHDLHHAAEVQIKATTILEDVSATHPESAALREYLGEGLNRLATYRRELGDPSASLEADRRANQIFKELVSADPKDVLAKANFGFSNNGIALCLKALRKPDLALKVFRESVASFEEMSVVPASSNRYVRTGLAQSYSGLGDLYTSLASSKNISPSRQLEDWKEARTSCQKSLAVWNDKQKREELESDERDETAKVVQCIATAESHLNSSSRKP